VNDLIDENVMKILPRILKPRKRKNRRDVGKSTYTLPFFPILFRCKGSCCRVACARTLIDSQIFNSHFADYTIHKYFLRFPLTTLFSFRSPVPQLKCLQVRTKLFVALLLTREGRSPT
jgi:hypothetical protein